MSNWSWKDGDVDLNRELNLLYEPGNWGDVLKSLWAVEVVAQLEVAGPTLRVLDPYSGALDYPCTDAARQRLWPAYRKLQQNHLKNKRLASTGRLIQDACTRRGLSCRSVICEKDPARRASWETFAEFREGPPLELLKTCRARF